MSDQIKSECKATTNYELFSRSKFNREINMPHVKKLMSSIESRNMLWLRPIEVTKNMEILDGQHRLEAAKGLGIPIYYRVTDKMTFDDVGIINAAQRSWTTKDFFEYHCSKSIKSYLDMKKYMAKEGISFACAYALGVNSHSEAVYNFRNGKYEFNLDQFAIHVAHARETIDWIVNIIGPKSFLKSGKCFRSLVIFLKHEEIDYEKFRYNFEVFVNKFFRCSCQKDYIQAFLNIYNFKAHEKLAYDDLFPNGGQYKKQVEE